MADCQFIDCASLQHLNEVIGQNDNDDDGGGNDNKSNKGKYTSLVKRKS